MIEGIGKWRKRERERINRTRHTNELCVPSDHQIMDTPKQTYREIEGERERGPTMGSAAVNSTKHSITVEARWKVN